MPCVFLLDEMKAAKTSGEAKLPCMIDFPANSTLTTSRKRGESLKQQAKLDIEMA
jgi:hypothetical protein